MENMESKKPSGSSEFLKNFVLGICLFLFSIILIPIVFFCVAIPLALIRLFAIYSAQYLRPDLKPLSPESGIVCIDDYWGQPQHVVGGPIYVDKPIEKTIVIQRIEEILAEGKFQEFRYLLRRWMGILFWEQCHDFDLSKHVTEYPNVRTLEDFRAQHAQVFRKPFTRDQPLWEIMLLPNYMQNGQYAFMMRIHHVVTDGLGFRAVLHALAGQELSPDRPPLTLWEIIQGSWNTPIIQYKLAVSLLRDINWNSWIKKTNGEERPPVHTYQCHIPIKILKEAASQSGVTVSEVLLTGLATSIMENGPEPLPKHVSAIFPLPKPGHPTTMFTNQVYLTTIAFPLHEKNLQKRLELIKEEHKFKRETASIYDVSMQVVGTLLQVIQWYPDASGFCTLSLSNVNLSVKPWTMFGAEVLDADLTIDVIRHIPLVVVFLGYKDKINVILRGRSDVFSENHLKKMVHRIVSCMEEMTN